MQSLPKLIQSIHCQTFPKQATFLGAAHQQVTQHKGDKQGDSTQMHEHGIHI